MIDRLLCWLGLHDFYAFVNVRTCRRCQHQEFRQ